MAKCWDKRERASKNYCMDCGKAISKRAMRCRSCAPKAIWLKKERRPANQCIDCGKEICNRSTRCNPCTAKVHWESKEFRLKQSRGVKADWAREGQRLKHSEGLKAAHARGVFGETWRAKQSKARKECWARGDYDGVHHTEKCRQKHSESAKAAWARGDYDGGEWGHSQSKAQKAAWARGDWSSEETKLRKSKSAKAAHARGDYDSEQYRLKKSEAAKAAWERGAYNGAFHSPTRPEIDLVAALDELGIKHIPQYRIKNYIYDAYLPDYNILIEYDGWMWHYSQRAIEQGRGKKDATKGGLAKDAGLGLIRLKGLPERDLTYDEIYLQLSEELANGSP